MLASSRLGIVGSVNIQHVHPSITDPERTGVRSRSDSASFADVAASTRSSHLFPKAEAAGGSAENAFLFSRLSLRPWSLDLVLSCFAFRACCVTLGFRGLAGFSRLCIGGSVEERSGGECVMIEGSSSRGLGDWNGGIELCWTW